MATHLEHALYRLRHSLRRRAAGEHVVDDHTLIDALVSEWELNARERGQMIQAAMEWEAEQAARRSQEQR